MLAACGCGLCATCEGGRILIGDRTSPICHYKRGLAMVVQGLRACSASESGDNVARGLRAQKQPKALSNGINNAGAETVGMVVRHPLSHQLSAASSNVAIAPLPLRVLLLDVPHQRWTHRFVIIWWKKSPVFTVSCRNSLFSTSPTIKRKRSPADKIGIMRDGSLIAHGETRAYISIRPIVLPPNS